MCVHIYTYVCVHVVRLNVLGTILVQKDLTVMYQSSSALATHKYMLLAEHVGPFSVKLLVFSCLTLKPLRNRNAATFLF